MKKFCVGVVLASALLSAQKASAFVACNLCPSSYPCDWDCAHCVPSREGPGLWFTDGDCWGEVVWGTCRDVGQCTERSSSSSWRFNPVTDQGASTASPIR